jgi:uncharacterized protein (TIGR02246 family)
MKILRNTLVVVALASLAAGATTLAANASEVAAPPIGPPPPMIQPAEIEGVVLEYGRALDSDDLAAVMNVYAEDAVVTPPGQPVNRGAAEVSTFYENLFAVADVQITFTIESVNADRNLAYVTSHSDAVLKFKDGSPDGGGRGRELFVLRRGFDGWKIVAYWFNN